VKGRCRKTVPAGGILSRPYVLHDTEREAEEEEDDSHYNQSSLEKN